MCAARRGAMFGQHVVVVAMSGTRVRAAMRFRLAIVYRVYSYGAHRRWRL